MSGKKKILTDKEANRVRLMAEDNPTGALKELRTIYEVKRGLQVGRQFTIDAIGRTAKRRTPLTTTGSLDQEFTSDFSRTELLSTGRDIFQNFSFAYGIKRQHIKNVIGVGPRLQLTTGDEEYNERGEKYFNRRKNLIDVRRRPFNASLRVGESAEILDGDYGIMIVQKGQVQYIEGDRIRDPTKGKRVKRRKYINGVETTMPGTPLAYHLWNRGPTPGSMRYAKRVQEENFIHCYRDERFDQARGMPWIVSAVNDLQDLRETLEAAKGKWKIENMLGVAIESDLPESSDLLSLWGNLTDFTEGDAKGNDEEKYEVKLGQGIHSFELRPGEKIKTIESTTPNNTFEPMTLLLIRIIALTLDMPLEIALQYFTRGSYSAHRASFLQYRDAITMRRSEIEENKLDRLMGWMLRRAIKTGALVGPKTEVKDPTEHIWQWPGMGLLDPDKQRKGDAMGYGIGVESQSDICGRDGRHWQDVATQRIKEIAWIEKAAKEAGVDPNKVLPNTEVAIAAAGSASENENDDGENNDD